MFKKYLFIILIINAMYGLDKIYTNQFDEVSKEIIKHLRKYSSSYYEPQLGRKKE